MELILCEKPAVGRDRASEQSDWLVAMNMSRAVTLRFRQKPTPTTSMRSGWGRGGNRRGATKGNAGGACRRPSYAHFESSIFPVAGSRVYPFRFARRSGMY